MNPSLEQLASDIGLAAAENEALRLSFGYVCADRVRHLLEEPLVVECLDVLRHYLDGQAGRGALEHSRLEAARLATTHRGSNSLDGCGHAAVSATYATARALEGKALEAASYAAYASVYALGGSAAVGDRESFEAEFVWQAASLRAVGAALARGGAAGRHAPEVGRRAAQRSNAPEGADPGRSA